MARGPQGAQSCLRLAALLRDSCPPCGVLLHRGSRSLACQGGPAVDEQRRQHDDALISFSVDLSCLSLTPQVGTLMSRPGLPDESAL